MNNSDRENHWQGIYRGSELENRGWYQPVPQTSLRLLKNCQLPKSAKIIDIGGGDSLLVDHLLKLGYRDLSVLDISAAALERTQKRLGPQAAKVNWIVGDVTRFDTDERFDCWHDRAAFHFLNEVQEIEKYVRIAHQLLHPAGRLIIGTFSPLGPEKCSGLPVSRYSEESLTHCFSPGFDKIESINIDHQTPGGTKQNYIFCSLRKSEQNCDESQDKR